MFSQNLHKIQHNNTENVLVLVIGHFPPSSLSQNASVNAVTADIFQQRAMCFESGLKTSSISYTQLSHCSLYPVI